MEREKNETAKWAFRLLVLTCRSHLPFPRLKRLRLPRKARIFGRRMRQRLALLYGATHPEGPPRLAPIQIQVEGALDDGGSMVYMSTFHVHWGLCFISISA